MQPWADGLSLVPGLISGRFRASMRPAGRRPDAGPPPDTHKLMNWTQEFPAAITVCDRQGTVLAMNDQSCKMFAKDGGAALIGQSLYPCHPGDSAEKLHHLLQQETPNVYTIEKNGRKKLIYQAPWYEQ